MTAIPKVPIGGGSGNLTATYLLQNHTGDTGLTSAWYMVNLATSAGGPGHLFILADGTPLVDPTVYIQGYPMNPTSVVVAQAPNNLATFAAFTYDGIGTLTVPIVDTTTVANSLGNLSITGLGDTVIQPAGSLLIQPTVATRLVGFADGFVVTTGANGTLGVDTNTYLTGSLTTGRVALSVTAASVTDDAGLTYDAATNILTATGAFLGPVFYNPFGAVTVQAQGGTMLLDCTGVGDPITIQSRNGDVTLACNTNITGPTILLTRQAAGGGFVDYTQHVVVASAAGAVLDSTDWNAGVITISGNTHITTATGFNLMVIRSPTFFSNNALTVDTAATFVIEGPPLANGGGGGKPAITTTYGLWVQDGGARIDAINTYIAGGAGTYLALRVATTSGAYASVGIDQYYFGQALVGWTSGGFTDLAIGCATGTVTRLQYLKDAVGAGTDAITIDGTTGAIVFSNVSITMGSSLHSTELATDSSGVVVPRSFARTFMMMGA